MLARTRFEFTSWQVRNQRVSTHATPQRSFGSREATIRARLKRIQNVPEPILVAGQLPALTAGHVPERGRPRPFCALHARPELAVEKEDDADDQSAGSQGPKASQVQDG